MHQRAFGVVLSVTLLALALPGRAQRADGPEFRVNPTVTGDERAPDVAVDGAGAFLISWKDHCADCFAAAAYGLPAGLFNFIVSATYTGQTLVGPAVSGLATGGFVVAYAENPKNQVASFRINSGTLVPVSTSTANAKISVDIASDGAGNYVVVWEDAGEDGSGSGIY